MKRTPHLQLILPFLFMLTLHNPDVSAQSNAHPFLICSRESFPELRQRAEREPWKGMKSDALSRAEKGMPDFKKPRELQSYTGAVALAYILDPENAETHAARVKESILEGLARVQFDPDREWTGVVEPLAAAFTCILALDIVHDDLSAEDIAACESYIQQQISKIPRTGYWPAARYGTFGTWDIYRGVRTEPDDAYFENFIRQMTEDGVSSVSPGYAFARLGTREDRIQKGAYADVLEYTGIDRRYYRNEQIRQFYRFLFSGALTPAKKHHLFGDIGPGWGWGPSALFWRVGRFDSEAAGYAAWLLEGYSPSGHILPYVLMQEPLPEPVVPTSKLYMQGAAVFREPADSPDSLGAMLYNITSNDEWHTHEEVNHLSLSAYGERLLVHGGWMGDETRPPWRNNTLAIAGQPHASRTGAGLEEGLTADGFDYARGDSGNALGDDHFYRNLLLIHGRDGAPGYFAVVDEVRTAPGESVHLYFQPASEQPAREVVPRSRYRSRLDHHTERKDLELDIVYVLPADEVKQERTPSGDLRHDPGAGEHIRLEAVFHADKNGNRKLLTLLLPRTAEMPSVEVIPHAYSRGAVTLRFASGVTDTLLLGEPEEEIRLENILFQGSFLYLRQNEGAPESWFVKEGVRLELDGKPILEKPRPVNLFQRTEAKPVSPTRSQRK